MRKLLIYVIGLFSAISWLRHHVGKVDGKWVWLLVDDAMISMDYARSWVEGCGLVWYCGWERVQGYTNPLWTFYMAFWHLWGIPREWTSFPIILTGLVLWLVYLGLVYKLASRVGGERVGLWSALGVSLWLPSSYWFTSGLETGLVATLLVGVVYRIMTRGVDGWVLGMVAIAMWTRLEAGLPLMVGAGWRYVMDKDRRGGILLGLTTLVSAASVFVWQKVYYGDFLPLTYYLKQTGIGREVLILNGLWATVWHVRQNLPLYGLLAWGLFFHRRDFSRWGLPVAMAFSIGLYNIWVGGDAWEEPLLSNRYWTTAMGLWALGLGMGLEIFRSFGAKIILLAAFFTGFYPKVVYVLRNPGNLSIFFSDVFLAEILKEYLHTGARVGIDTAGTLPYFTSDYEFYDILGKNTREVAHLPMRKGHYKGGLWQVFLGHSKYDTSLVKKWQLDAIRVPSYIPMFRNFAKSGGYCTKTLGGLRICFRKDSPRVRWEKHPCD